MSALALRYFARHANAKCRFREVVIIFNPNGLNGDPTNPAKSENQRNRKNLKVVPNLLLAAFVGGGSKMEHYIILDFVFNLFNKYVFSLMVCRRKYQNDT